MLPADETVAVALNDEAQCCFDGNVTPILAVIVGCCITDQRAVMTADIGNDCAMGT